MASWWKTDGTVIEITPAKGKAFSLAELQRYVGGDIQLVWAPGDRAVLYLNENGKYRKLPRNERATELMRERLLADDYIAGDTVLCTRVEAGV